MVLNRTRETEKPSKSQSKAGPGYYKSQQRHNQQHDQGSGKAIKGTINSRTRERKKPSKAQSKAGSGNLEKPSKTQSNAGPGKWRSYGHSTQGTRSAVEI